MRLRLFGRPLVRVCIWYVCADDNERLVDAREQREKERRGVLISGRGDIVRPCTRVGKAIPSWVK